MSMPPISDSVTPDPAPAATCRNCATPLLGDHCYACGQPVKGLVRPLGSLFGDVLDSVFDLDIRVFRTIGPLFAKPAFLSREYFAGRQIRYVTPFRLFFFLAVVTFFFAQLTTDGPDFNIGGEADGIPAATTVAEVEKRRDAALAELAKGKQKMMGTPAAAGIVGMEASEQAVREEAARRIKQLQEAQAKGESPPKPDKDSNHGIKFKTNGKPWDAETNPLDTWLPAFGDRWFNKQLARGDENIQRLQQDPSAFKDAVLGAVPSTLFVLVPIFALMLKLAYLFKRRLYMEHLVIALHSHAFLCLDLLLVLLVRALADVTGATGFIGSVFDWTEGLLLLWMPIYLLLMQKRVYGQGWPMTLLKYFVLGTCYTILLSFAVLASMAIGLVAM